MFVRLWKFFTQLYLVQLYFLLKKGATVFFLNRKNFRFQPFCGENFIANLAAAAAAAAEKVSLLNVISTPSWLF